jgi:hypothetical protein
MATDPKRENERELQPDPLLKEGRSSTAWVWIIGTAMLVAIVVTFFAVDRNNGQQATTPPSQHASRFTTGASNKPPHTALPAGRTRSSSPKEGDYHTVR